MGQPRVQTQLPQRRITTFHEVSLGYSKKIATEEAKRCPQCADPVCQRACPLGIEIPTFIRYLREGKVNAAFQKIKEKSVLPSVCGRICSAPCEIACILNPEDSAIGIRALERYASDSGRPQGSIKRNIPQGKRVAIVGSGPSGLTAAAELAKKGFQVTIFESMDQPGGVLRYGIPEFRIPKKILDAEITEIKALGVEIKTNFFVGQTATFEELFEKGFSAILG